LNLATNTRVAFTFQALNAHLTSDGSAMVYQSPNNLSFDIHRYVFATKKFTLIKPVEVPAAFKTGWSIGQLLDINGNGTVLALQMGSDARAALDVFLYDTVAKVWREPDRSFPGYVPGVGGGHASSQIRLSSSGRIAVFMTYSTFGCTRCQQVWVYNWFTNTNTAASTRYTGATLNDGNASFPDISPDGSAVSFRSDASNIVKGITTVKPRVYVRKLATKVTTMITDHESGYDTKRGPALSGNGAVITLLEDRPTNVAGHVYNLPQPVMYYVATKASVMLDQPAGTAKPNNLTERVMAAGTAHKIVFTSMATNFIPVLTPANKTVDRIFVSTFL
jgi:Tol biopolymer transport system component